MAHSELDSLARRSPSNWTLICGPTTSRSVAMSCSVAVPGTDLQSSTAVAMVSVASRRPKLCRRVTVQLSLRIERKKSPVCPISSIVFVNRLGSSRALSLAFISADALVVACSISDSVSCVDFNGCS
ncbi:MAG TPA: hypothetical protein DCQ06_05840 [Myxococcales bacterium]|nr:hypothetical protein [Myxococcales bacterium]